MRSNDFDKRYYVEHVLLPHAFYEHGLTLMEQLEKNPGRVMRHFYKKLEKDYPGYICPYNRNDFWESNFIVRTPPKSLIIQKIYMPDPESELLCQAVYLVYDKSDGQSLYLTQEATETGPLITGVWTPDEKHISFHPCPKDDEMAVYYIGHIFMRYKNRQKTA